MQVPTNREKENDQGTPRRYVYLAQQGTPRRWSLEVKNIREFKLFFDSMHDPRSKRPNGRQSASNLPIVLIVLYCVVLYLLSRQEVSHHLLKSQDFCSTHGRQMERFLVAVKVNRSTGEKGRGIVGIKHEKRGTGYCCTPNLTQGYKAD